MRRPLISLMRWAGHSWRAKAWAPWGVRYIPLFQRRRVTAEDIRRAKEIEAAVRAGEV